MKSPASFCSAAVPALILALIFVPGVVAAAEWKQTASVYFIEMAWGRFTQITIEELPDLGDDPGAYLDPAKRNALMAEVMATEMAADPDAVGRTILITVPGLEYGMMGTWDNVRIESGNGISVPPDEDKVGTATSEFRNTRYTGSLVITEFTEDVLKGSYRAALYTNRLSEAEMRARRRNALGVVAGEMNFDLAPYEAPAVSFPDVPEHVDDKDAALLKRIQAAGVPTESQGMMLEMLKGMPPERVDMVLESYNDSY